MISKGIKVERTILHCGKNNFYASVKCMFAPSLRGHPVAVVGDVLWTTGILQEVEKLKHIIERKASKVGGTGKCYIVVILGTETALYEEDEGRWFVEAKENVRW